MKNLIYKLSLYNYIYILKYNLFFRQGLSKEAIRDKLIKTRYAIFILEQLKHKTDDKHLTNYNIFNN